MLKPSFAPAVCQETCVVQRLILVYVGQLCRGRVRSVPGPRGVFHALTCIYCPSGEEINCSSLLDKEAPSYLLGSLWLDLQWRATWLTRQYPAEGCRLRGSVYPHLVGECMLLLILVRLSLMHGDVASEVCNYCSVKLSTWPLVSKL